MAENCAKKLWSYLNVSYVFHLTLKTSTADSFFDDVGKKNKREKEREMLRVLHTGQAVFLASGTTSEPVQ